MKWGVSIQAAVLLSAISLYASGACLGSKEYQERPPFIIVYYRSRWMRVSVIDW